MYAQVLGAVGGFILSLLFSYIPGFKTRFDNLDKKYGAEEGGNFKRLIMAVCIIVVGIAAFGLSCAGWLDKIAPDMVLACSDDGVVDLIMSIVFALAANQGTFALTPRKGQ